MHDALICLRMWIVALETGLIGDLQDLKAMKKEACRCQHQFGKYSVLNHVLIIFSLLFSACGCTAAEPNSLLPNYLNMHYITFV